jgi:hypothetical protein
MIGERLEEARKRKGVTIREAAEATKIRGDFLTAMEDNQFDLGLPSIYVRGFLKNYARFLKLDAQRILNDFDAHQLGKVPQANRPARESLGSMDINRGAGQAADEDNAPSAEPSQQRVVVADAPEDDSPDPVFRVNLPKRENELKSPPSAETMRESSRARRPSSSRQSEDDSWEDQRDLFIKIGVSVTAVAIVVLLIVVLFNAIRGGGDTPPVAADQLEPSATATLPSPTPAAVISGPETIILRASETVSVIVEQTMDRRRLFGGTLNAGERISLEKDGPVSIRFTEGSALLIEKGDQRMRPPAGHGRTVID